MVSWVKELEKENIEDIDVKIGACTLYIFAKIAKADGNISKLELDFVKKKFHIHHKDFQNIDRFMHSESLDKKRNYIDEAKEICRNTRGPIASIFYQGLDRSDEGLEATEKAVEAYGGVQMGLLEKGLSWISLFIALAPMLGFMGTVIGMIVAFDDIESAGTISATVVAGGIKQALLTTVAGLFYLFFVKPYLSYY